MSNRKSQDGNEVESTMNRESQDENEVETSISKLRKSQESMSNRRSQYQKRGTSEDKHRSFSVGPWSEDEHRSFLIGLQKYKRGNWKAIAKHFVPTRSSTQVASHAQKYFDRFSGKRKQRESVFDIVPNKTSRTNLRLMPSNINAEGSSNPSQRYPTGTDIVTTISWVPVLSYSRKGQIPVLSYPRGKFTDQRKIQEDNWEFGMEKSKP